MIPLAASGANINEFPACQKGRNPFTQGALEGAMISWGEILPACPSLLYLHQPRKKLIAVRPMLPRHKQLETNSNTRRSHHVSCGIGMGQVTMKTIFQIPRRVETVRHFKRAREKPRNSHASW
jgi:hypothetical protein